jgi:hypothetical protein
MIRIPALGFLDKVRRFTPIFRHLRYGGYKGVFAWIYKTNAWGDDESASGYGSNLKYTENIRGEIPKLIGQFKIKTFLDAPCGDYHWFQLVQRDPSVLYIGGEIVPELVQRNHDKYASENTRFKVLDITRQPLPVADMWLCRNCLFHLSNRDILRVISNFVSSKIPYWLVTTHQVCQVNIDIVTGGYRELNLRLSPFFFPQPLLQVDDWIEGFRMRTLGLWDRRSLAEAISQNRLMPKTLRSCADAARLG